MLRLLATVLLFLAGPVSAQEASQFGPLERQDIRFAQIADRLLVANAGLCNRTMPVTGLILHSYDQYGAGIADSRFVDGPVAVSSIVPHSAADRAGLQRDDVVVAIGGIALPSVTSVGSGNLREAAFDVLAAQSAGQSVTLRYRRDGAERTATLAPPAGCRSLVEIVTGAGFRAQSDGRVIQMSYDFASSLQDDEMAVVLAHELAHTVLEHRRRKVEAGIDNGALAEFGRNQQVNRQAEIEADRLSVHLLANAGYDAGIVPAYWRSDAAGGLSLSFVYPSQEARARLVEREIAMYLPARRGPSWPGHLLELRDRPFAD